MSTNKAMQKEDKVTKIQPKTESKSKTNSSKVDSNYRKFDSFDNKYNERTYRSNKAKKPVDNTNRSRTYRNDDSNHFGNNNERRFHHDHYFYNSNRFTSNSSSDRNLRPEPRPSAISVTNGEISNKSKNQLEHKSRQNSFKGGSDTHSYSGYHSRRRHYRRSTSPEVHQNLQQKLDELTALKSIFQDENILSVDETELKGRFLAEPEVNKNGLIVFYEINDKNKNYRRFSSQRHQNESNCVEKRENEEFCVQHLPPIELYFELSRKYPLKLNPMFLVSCKWLSMEQLGMN